MPQMIGRQSSCRKRDSVVELAAITLLALGSESGYPLALGGSKVRVAGVTLAPKALRLQSIPMQKRSRNCRHSGTRNSGIRSLRFSAADTEARQPSQ